MLKDNNEMKKAHNEAYDNIKPSKELIDITFELMKKESRKEKKDYSNVFKKNFRPMAALACSLILFIGLNIYSKTQKDNFDKPQGSEISNGMDSPQFDEAPRKINISGVIEEVSKDGSRIRITEKWILIDGGTEFLFNEDGTQVSNEFKVGNYVEAFTYDDIALPEVKAEYIYTNKIEEH